MKILLSKSIKNPIIVSGFPGLGFVASIALEFLIEHLKVEQVGRIVLEEAPAMIAVHNGKKIDPFGIFYNKNYNIIVMHAVTPVQGLEWKIAGLITNLAEKTQAKEIISVEGVAGTNSGESKSFYYSNIDKNHEKFEKFGIEELKEGIIMGVAGALLINCDKLPITFIFSETHSSLPDSKAAAKIIEGLDKYLGLKIDYAPLLKQAENFEQKLQNLMKKSIEATDLSEKKRLSYVG